MLTAQLARITRVSALLSPTALFGLPHVTVRAVTPSATRRFVCLPSRSLGARA